jgi:ABC-type uncharacterized transport system ATPase subunit
MCNRVIIISQGRIVEDGSVADICKKVPTDLRVVVTIDSASEQIQQELVGMNAVVTNENGVIQATFSGAGGDKVFDSLKSRSWPVREIREERPSLEDAFRHLTKESRG